MPFFALWGKQIHLPRIGASRKISRFFAESADDARGRCEEIGVSGGKLRDGPRKQVVRIWPTKIMEAA